jgi:hypothetical protein
MATGSGAFAVFIDQQAGTGMSGTPVFQRVVPLLTAGDAGGVKFTKVFLSLAYDTFGDPTAPATFPATVRVLHDNGTVDTIDAKVGVGRTVVAAYHTAGVVAAGVQLNPPKNFHPEVTALVEYAYPVE